MTAIVLTHNDAKTIGRTLKSIAPLRCPLLVIDDLSTDDTQRESTSHAAKVITQKFEGDFSVHRNRALEHSSTDWVLFLDSDEELTSEAVSLMQRIPETTAASAYMFRRIDSFWGTTMLHGETGNAWVARLVNKKRGAFKRPVHEVWHPATAGKSVERLPGIIMHYPHPTIQSFLEHINRYSSLEANSRARQGKQSSVIEIMCVPPAKFVYTYVLKAGFLDGAAGFVYSFMMSFHSFLVRAKLLQRTDTTPLWHHS